LLYLDGLAAALFALAATEKVLALQLAAPLAVMMGVLTSIGGGIARDVLAGRVSLLMSRDIYATPLLLGCTLYVLLRDVFTSIWVAGWIALVFTFGLRFLAIYKHLQMPACGFHAIRTLSPPTSGHSFHAHSDRQSERSDAGLHC
jgi:uncharacterized membrane protein YeiH